jgi:hypothetical protein
VSGVRQGFLLAIACVLAAAVTAATASAGRGGANVNVSISSVSHLEGNSGQTKFVFWVSLSKRSAMAVKVDYATNDGSALAGSDYSPVSGTIWFNPGELSKKVVVLVSGDTIFEGDEQFNVTLSNPKNIAIGVDSGIGTILDDDGIIICIGPFAPCPCNILAPSPAFDLCS